MVNKYRLNPVNQIPERHYEQKEAKRLQVLQITVKPNLFDKTNDKFTKKDFGFRERQNGREDARNPDKIQELAVILICTGFSALIFLVSAAIIVMIVKYRRRESTGSKIVSRVRSDFEVQCSRYDTVNGYHISQR